MLVFCLVCVNSAFGAAGDVVSCTVMANGCMVQVKFDHMATNGSAYWNSGVNGANGFVHGTNFSNGFITNRGVGTAPVLVLTMTDMGFDDTGTAITVQRTNYGTMICRAPYVNYTNLLESGDATSATETFAMSDYVFLKSSNVTASVSVGLYAMSGVTNNALASIAVTNNSAVRYPNVLATWSDVPWQLKSSSTYKLRCLAYQYFGQQRRPVRVVKFWSKDSAGSLNTAVFVTGDSIDASYGDLGPPIVERVATMDNTAFAQGNFVTNWFAAYPWIGDAAAVADCSAFSNEDSGYLRPFITFCDKNATWGSSYAIVDPTNGTTAGLVTTNATTALTVAPFATIGQAMNAIALTNFFKFGATRSNWDNSFIYLTNGLNIAWVGGTSASTRDENQSWLTITCHPNTTSNLVAIGSNTGSQSLQSKAKIKFKNISLGGWGNAELVNQGHHCVWFDQCWIQTNTGSSADLVRYSTNNFMTRCTVEANHYGFQFEVGDLNRDKWVIRGNNILAPVEHCKPYVFIGNSCVPTAVSQHSIANDSSLGAISPFFFCFNKVMKHDSAAVLLGVGLNANVTNGFCVIQNVLENCNNGNQPPFDVMNSAVANEVCTNGLIWNNTMLCVYHPPYNHFSSQLEYSEFYADANNLCEDFENNFDGEANPTANGARTNRWAIMYSVGRIGNAFGESKSSTGDLTSESTGGAGNFAFDGINTIYTTNQPNMNYFAYVNPLNYFANGTTADSAGNGNYRLKSTSPCLVYLPTSPLIAFDIEGVYRGGFDPPGAYASASPRKGGAFFGQ